MQAVIIKTFGSPDGLAVVDIPAPDPGPGQVGIATEAIGVAGVDVVIRRGDLAAYGFRPGHVPGGEVAGTVTAVGEGADPALIGRRVWAFTGTGGGYVEQAIAPAGEVVVLPGDLSAVDAVTLGSAGVVAHFALQHRRPGETVLVRGASGSIGIMAVQLAAHQGAGAIAVTTSSPERGRRLRELGATQVLDRSGNLREPGATPETGPAGRRRDKGGPNFDVVVDVVAGTDMPDFIDRLNPNGRLVIVGAVGGQPPADFGTKLMASFQRSLSVATFSAATVTDEAKNAVRTAHFAAAATGKLKAVVHEVLPLAQAAEAHREMDAGKVFGRIVLAVS
jgi:NADPH2:quinone reductase